MCVYVRRDLGYMHARRRRRVPNRIRDDDGDSNLEGAHRAVTLSVTRQNGCRPCMQPGTS